MNTTLVARTRPVSTAAATRLEPPALRLLAMFEQRIDVLVERIVDRVQDFTDAGGGYAGIPAHELRVATEANIRIAVQAMRENRRPSADELVLAAAVGELRARQGIPLETVLRGFRVAAREGFDLIRGMAAEAGIDATTSMALAGALWDWVDDISVELASAHGRVELTLARQAQQQRVAFVHGLIFGTLSTQSLTAGAHTFGLSLDTPHCVVRIRPTPTHPTDRLERLVQPASWTPGVVSIVEDDLVAILPAPPAIDVPVPVPAGLGPSLPLRAVNRSFVLATRALETAIAFNRPGLHRLDDLSLRAALVAEDHLSELLLRRYVAPVLELGAFGDELLRSLRVYFQHDQSVDAAAHALFVHPNTLRHRLSRFEETTGANLRNVEHLAEIWWALTRHELEPQAAAQ